VVGGANPNLPRLRETIAETGLHAEILLNIENMGECYAWAEFALLSASTIFLEAAASGLPCLLLQIAENQSGVLAAAESSGIALTLPPLDPWSGMVFAEQLALLRESPGERCRLSEVAKASVDGFGASRVVSAMLACRFHLRESEESDCEILWSWANDPETRRQSFHSDPISFEEHRNWFHRKLTSPKALLLIASTSDGVPFAMCWFKRQDDHAVVSVNFSPDYRSLGLGPRVLKKAGLLASRRFAVKKLLAYIKPSNIRSIIAFRKAGYVKVRHTDSDMEIMEWFPG
jgi:RimJ/RimL family protein N-acetyltransferase